MRAVDKARLVKSSGAVSAKIIAAILGMLREVFGESAIFRWTVRGVG